MFILGLQGSPRKRGNTDTFLAAFMDRAEQVGANVQTIQVARAGIVPCLGCGYCETHGTCVIADDPMSTDMYGLLRQADLVVAASPVYFYGMSAQLKVFIDRCQTLWSRKYMYKLKDPLAATRKGLLFSVAASSGRQLFEGVHLTAKYFFDAIDACFDMSLTYRGVEAKGAIRHQETLAADIDRAIQTMVVPLLNRRKVLFVSAQGACRAPMAAAMAQMQYGNSIHTDFAGWTPADSLVAPMIQALQDLGTDMGYRKPQPVAQAFQGSAPDLVIAINDDTGADIVEGVRTIHWQVSRDASPEKEAIDRLRLELGAHIAQDLAMKD